MTDRILICDDDEGIVDVMKLVLEDRGYNVEILFHSNDIFATVKNKMPAMILIDLWMPGLRGEEVVEKIKKDEATKAIPVVVVSANRNLESISKKVGANDYLVKPFDIIALEKVVEKYLLKR